MCVPGCSKSQEPRMGVCRGGCSVAKGDHLAGVWQVDGLEFPARGRTGGPPSPGLRRACSPAWLFLLESRPWVAGARERHLQTGC